MNLLTAGMIGSGVIRTTGQAWSDATADGKLTVVEGFGLIKSGLSATPYLNKTILHFDTAHGRLGYVRTEAIAVGNALTPLLGLVPGVNYHEAMQAAYGITAAMSSALYDALKDGILTLGELLDAIEDALRASPWGQKTLAHINPHDNIALTAFAATNLLAMTATGLLALIKGN